MVQQSFRKPISSEHTTRYLYILMTFQKLPFQHNSVCLIFFCMPFALRNAAQTFQHFIEGLHGLDFVYAYINDLLIASNSESEHLQHLELLFQCLSTYGIVINPAKCIFSTSLPGFLGYCVSADGILFPPKFNQFKISCRHPNFGNYVNS